MLRERESLQLQYCFTALRDLPQLSLGGIAEKIKATKSDLAGRENIKIFTVALGRRSSQSRFVLPLSLPSASFLHGISAVF